MAGAGTHPVLRFLRRLGGPVGDAADAALLQQFTRHRDEAAFAALVRRHGPMVFGVCTRVLGNSADVEDAFQATFLVLVRRAGSVGRPERLANWLYGVAYRTALKSKTSTARRRRHERQALARAASAPPEERAWHDLRPVLDEELNRLPERYRTPLVLCDLEGRTHEEAARALGCPRETVTTRLTRGRQRLRDRLVRRGITLSGGGLAVLLSSHAASAAPPGGLTAAAVRCATAGMIPTQVVTLAEGVIHAMLLNRLRLTVSLVLGFVLVASGTGFLVRGVFAAAPGGERDEPAAAPPPAPGPAPGGQASGQSRRQGASVKEMAPVVVKTVPQAGDTQVDAQTTKEIRVTFSKDMADGSWSWTQISKETYPPTAGKPSYDKDKRTCVLPVKLEPGKTYVLWLNPERFQGFRDTDGRPAAFYPLVFETKP